jgi:hypothetical protein
MTGRDEMKMSQIVQGDSPVTAAALIRTDMLDGKPPTLSDIQELSFRDLSGLRKMYEEVEGGVDTTIQVDCPECQKEFDYDLSPGEQGFFFPDRVQKNSKMKSSG